MIDLIEEHLIAIREVPRRLPHRRSGRRIHISAVYRWIQRGARGVRLESVRIGGTTYTSAEALQRFADRLSQPARHDSGETPITTRARQRQIEQAAKQVEAILNPARTKSRPPTPATLDDRST